MLLRRGEGSPLYTPLGSCIVQERVHHPPHPLAGAREVLHPSNSSVYVPLGLVSILVLLLGMHIHDSNSSDIIGQKYVKSKVCLNLER